MNSDIINKISKMVIESFKNPLSFVYDVSRDFKDQGIDYAIIGAISLGVHNYIRHTDDIDILVSKKTSHLLKNLIGNGYTLRPGSNKNMYFHSPVGKIEIDILIEGQREGDVMMPDPIKIRNKISKVWYINLPNLIDLKILSGRGQDIEDIKSLIRENDLDDSFVRKIKNKKKFLKIIKEIEK